MELLKESSDEDNFDLVHTSATKLTVLRPILKPVICNALFKEMRKRAKTVLNECLKTFNHSSNYQLHSEEVEQEDLDGDVVEPELSWLAKYTGNVNPINDINSAPKETQPIDADAEDKPPLVSIKRRLRRHKSEFNKKTRGHVPRDASRTDLINKGMAILDMVVDYAEDNLTMSTAISLLVKYEDAWGTFPSTSHRLVAVTADKIEGHVCFPPARFPLQKSKY